MAFAPNEHKDGQIWSWFQALESGYGYIGSQFYVQEYVFSSVGSLGMNRLTLL